MSKKGGNGDSSAAAVAERPAKRSASPATCSPKAKQHRTTAATSVSSAAATVGGTRSSASSKLTNKDAGPLVRSPEALASLKLKKTEAEIWKGIVPLQRRTGDGDFDASSMWKMVTWNVAGLRGLLKKDSAAIEALLLREQPDVLCLQETKLNSDDAAGNAALGGVAGYQFVDHPCTMKKGYSGTRTYLKTDSVVAPRNAVCTRGFHLPSTSATPAVAGEQERAGTLRVEAAGDEEGRVITAVLQVPPPAAASTQHSTIAVVNTYVANSGMGLSRLPYRIQSFDQEMRSYLTQLDAWCQGGAGKAESTGAALPSGFIWAGDLNVADCDFDRYYAGTYKTMQESSGFAPEERFSFRQTLSETKSVDAFRLLYPQSGPAYTFWSARLNGRARGWGWRLDYFVVSSRLAPLVVDCFPMPEVLGSDHCPVQLWMKRQP